MVVDQQWSEDLGDWVGCWEDCALGTWWRGKKSLRIGVWGGVTRGQRMFGKCVGYCLAGGFGCGVWRFGMWYSISVSPCTIPSGPTLLFMQSQYVPALTLIHKAHIPIAAPSHRPNPHTTTSQATAGSKRTIFKTCKQKPTRSLPDASQGPA